MYKYPAVRKPFEKHLALMVHRLETLRVGQSIEPLCFFQISRVIDVHIPLFKPVGYPYGT